MILTCCSTPTTSTNDELSSAKLWPNRYPSKLSNLVPEWELHLKSRCLRLPPQIPPQCQICSLKIDPVVPNLDLSPSHTLRYELNNLETRDSVYRFWNKLIPEKLKRNYLITPFDVNFVTTRWLAVVIRTHLQADGTSVGINDHVLIHYYCYLWGHIVFVKNCYIIVVKRLIANLRCKSNLEIS